MEEGQRAMYVLKLPSSSSIPDTPPRRQVQSGQSPFSKVQSFGGLEKEAQAYPSPPMSDSSPPLHRQVARSDDESSQFQAHPRSIPQAAEITRTPPTILPAPVPVTGALTQYPTAIQQGSALQRSQYGPGSLPGLRPAPHYRSSFAPSYQLEATTSTAPSIISTEPANLPVQLTPLSGQSQWRTARPARRAKAHVASACVNCKRAHLSCDVQRPCSRCVAGGKEDTCFDVQHKKRGRPRLREDRGARAQESEEHSAKRQRVQVGAAGPSIFPSAGIVRPDVQQPASTAKGELARTQQSRKGTLSGVAASTGLMAPPYLSAITETLPYCLLDVDFNLIKINGPLADYLQIPSGTVNRPITDYVTPQSQNAVQLVKEQIRNERSMRDPSYLPPILSKAEHEAIKSITEADLENFTRGFAERKIMVEFDNGNGISRGSFCQLQLAKTNVFFVVLRLSMSKSTAKDKAFSGIPDLSGRPTSSSNFDFTFAAGPSRNARPSDPSLYPASSSLSHYGQQQMQPMGRSTLIQSPSSHSFTSLPRMDASQYQPVRQATVAGSSILGITDSSPLTNIPAESSSQTLAQKEPRADSMQTLHLPPILGQVTSTSPASSTLQSPEIQTKAPRTHLREQSSEDGGEGSTDKSKKRRLNIHEFLE